MDADATNQLLRYEKGGVASEFEIRGQRYDLVSKRLYTKDKKHAI